MRKGIFITGTDTGVGKTIVAAGLAGAFRIRGINTGVMKPVETGTVKQDDTLIPQDAKFLKEYSGVEDSLSLINPYRWELPLAPEVAAQLAGEKVVPSKIIDGFRKLQGKHQFLIVEGIGGLLVPLNDSYLVSDLVKELNLPVIIVAKPGLGTINHTLLTIESARKAGLEIVGVIINYASPEEKGVCQETNPEIISRWSNVKILGTVPYLEEDKKTELLVETVAENIDLEAIIGNNPVLRSRANTKDEAEEKPLSALPSLKERDKRYLWHPFTQMQDWLKEEPLVIEEGKGSYLKDTEGQWYLDGVSSLWVNLHGHRRQEIDKAIREQLDKIAHSTLLGLANVPSIQLAEKLVQITPSGLSKVFYSDDGSTAVEIALKIAFQHWQQKSKAARGKTKFISLKNAYHGDTLGAVSVGGMDLFHRIYKPFLFNSLKIPSPYCYRCSLGKIHPQCRLACLGELERVLEKEKGKVAGLIIEPLVQAAAGMLISPPGYLESVSKLCQRYQVLMIADEVATGFGHTGKMFACEHEEVTPDILILAKGITGGYLPMAATLVREDIYNSFLGEHKDKKTFFHGHTYTGNPLACAAALANLDIFDKDKILEKLPGKVRLLEKELEGYKNLEHVGEVRQKGMMVGIELVKDKEKKTAYPYQEKIVTQVIREARKRGLIIRPLGNVIVLMPQLSVSNDELREILDITRDSIKQVISSP